jgi:hypothetical protein
MNIFEEFGNKNKTEGIERRKLELKPETHVLSLEKP